MQPDVSIDYKFRYLLDDWQKEAIEVLNDKFREQLRATDEVLMDFADKAESSRIQNHFFEAQREIWLKMEDMSLDFHDLLTKSLSRFPLKSERREPKLGAETLSLVNIDLYERNLALQTLAEKAEKNNYQELYLLAQRLSVINHGQPVDMDQIPASPHHMCEIFARCINRLTIENDALLVLYTLFDKYVLSALPDLHRKLNESLVKAGILPTLKYSVRNAPAGQPGQVLKSPERENEDSAHHRPAPDDLGEETMMRIHELLKANRRRQRKLTPPPPGVEAATPQEVAQAAASVTLAQASSFPDEEQLFQPVDHGTIQQVQEEMAVQRETIKRKVGINRLQEQQEDIIDLVGMLFEQMLDDESIPNAAKALLGHLHTTYIKIGLGDEDFFENPDHPARVFLDKAIAASAVWVDENDLKSGIYPFFKDAVFSIVRLRQQSNEDFLKLCQELDEKVSALEKKFEVMEKRTLENEQGKEQLLRAKDAAKRATGNIFGGQAVPAYCKKFVDEVWIDYLTLLQLREDGDGESEAWKEACKLGQRILWVCTSNEKGLGHAAQIETLDKQIRNQVGALLPHQERKIEDFIEALYAPDEATEQEEEAIPAYSQEEAETPEELDEETLKLYDKLRTLPYDTWFEFDSGTDQSFRAKLSWYNPLTDHFLFVPPRGRKSILMDINKLAGQIKEGRIIYFTDIKESFWNRAMHAIISMLERKTEPSSTQA